jgi:membrane-associated phospholipid phosphatase
VCGAALAAALFVSSAPARADDAPPTAPVPLPSSSGAAPSGATAAGRSSPVWQPIPLAKGQRFTIDPVADGVLIGGTAAISGLLSLILTTGEIKPTLPGPTSNLLSIDRLAVTQHIDPNAGTVSTIGLYATIGFAALDPFLSADLVDAVMYAETISLTETLTDITKIAVRRPRPIDYIDCPYGSPKTATSSACTGNTDLELSFFSGHASTVAAIGATATYLAFRRAGARSPRGWITLLASVGMTTFVSIERVRAGEHFPTDVLAGAFAGAMVGVLVPHLHRHVEEAPAVWISAAPRDGGGTLTLSGIF